jgi:drug/metabolite transporter (DMT)-like permease
MSHTTANLRHHPVQGICYMLLASFLFALADALGKQLMGLYPFMQVIWLRCAFGILFIGAAILARGSGRFRSRYPRWHLARSVVGIMLTTGIFMGLKYIPLAEVTALVFATPLLVALHTTVVMKEKIGHGPFAAILLGFGGVLLVVRPSPDHFHFAHLFVLGFACASAFMSITARRLSGSESILTLNFYVYPASLLLSSYSAWTQWQAPDIAGWWLFIGVSGLATLALLCVTKAMHCASPALVTPFDYTRIVWTVGIGWLVWGEFPDHLTGAGILVIIGCGLYLVTRPRAAPAATAVAGSGGDDR